MKGAYAASARTPESQVLAALRHEFAIRVQGLTFVAEQSEKIRANFGEKSSDYRDLQSSA